MLQHGKRIKSMDAQMVQPAPVVEALRREMAEFRSFQGAAEQTAKEVRRSNRRVA